MAETIETRVDALEREITNMDDAIREQFRLSHEFLVDALGKIDRRVTNVDERLTAVEGRLAALEEHLAAVEGRLTAIDERLRSLESCLASLETNLLGRFDRMDARFDDVVAHMTGFMDAQTSLNRSILERLERL